MRERAIALLLTLGFLAIPAISNAQALGTIAGAVKDASGAVLPGVTVEAASPALIEKVRTAVTDGSGSVPDRQSAARQLHRHVHAAGLQHGEARRRRGVGQLHLEHRRRDEGGQPSRRPSRSRARARSSTSSRPRRRASVTDRGVQGTADRAGRGSRWRRSCRPSAPRTRTSAACSAIRPAPRCRRTAAARATACR